jgi:hypothetical protein
MARKKTKKSIVEDVRVNAVLNQILDRLIDGKEILDEDGSLLTDHERWKTIVAFKQSIGLSNAENLGNGA